MSYTTLILSTDAAAERCNDLRRATHTTRWAESLFLRNTRCPAQYLVCFAAAPIRNYMGLLVSQGLAVYLQNMVGYNTSLGTVVRQEIA